MSFSAAVVGATGLVGSGILATLLTHPNISSVSALTRRPLPGVVNDPHARLELHSSTDTSSWPAFFAAKNLPQSIFISALGTTRGQAGSLEKQRQVDFDLNLSLAKAAKEAGVKVYVLVSTGAANANSSFPYLKMKGELEDEVSKLGFDKVAILQPGLLVGKREDFRGPELAMRYIANALGKISGNYLKDFWAQDADVVARAAVVVGLKCLDGTSPPGKKVWVVSQSDIVKYGRTEWADRD